MHYTYSYTKTKTRERDVVALENRVSELESSLLKYTQPISVTDDNHSTIGIALDSFSQLISNSAWHIKDALKKQKFSSKKIIGDFQDLFEEKEEESIKILLSKKAEDGKLDYTFVNLLIQKYLWEKIGETFFTAPICFDKQVADGCRCIEELFKTSELFTAEEATRFRLQVVKATTMPKTKRGFKAKLEEVKEKVEKEIFEAFFFMKRNSGNREIIKKLLDKAADISLRMSGQAEEIVMKNVMPTDPFSEDQLSRIEISQKRPSNEVLLGIAPVFLVKEWTLRKGRAICLEDTSYTHNIRKRESRTYDIRIYESSKFEIPEDDSDTDGSDTDDKNEDDTDKISVWKFNSPYRPQVEHANSLAAILHTFDFRISNFGFHHKKDLKYDLKDPKNRFFFIKLFAQEESDSINLLFSKKDIDYRVIHYLVAKYFYEKICEDIFAEPIAINEKLDTKRIEQKLQYFLLKRKEKVVDEMVQVLAAIYSKNEIRESIKQLVDLAVTASLDMHRIKEDIVVKKLMPGDPVYRNQMKSVDESDLPKNRSTVALGIKPVFLYEKGKDNTDFEESDSEGPVGTYLNGYIWCSKGSALWR